jgi:predicted Zn-ribbon and HTH transcriptional regulator
VCSREGLANVSLEMDLVEVSIDYVEVQSENMYNKPKYRRYEMPLIAAIVKCKKCGFEIRSDWKFCPNCSDKIVGKG